MKLILKATEKSSGLHRFPIISLDQLFMHSGTVLLYSSELKCNAGGMGHVITVYYKQLASLLSDKLDVYNPMVES